jgi:hypothetical protein
MKVRPAVALESMLPLKARLGVCSGTVLGLSEPMKVAPLGAVYVTLIPDGLPSSPIKLLFVACTLPWSTPLTKHDPDANSVETVQLFGPALEPLKATPTIGAASVRPATMRQTAPRPSTTRARNRRCVHMNWALR